MTIKMKYERKEDELGDVIHEKYRLIELLGEGGVGSAFLAEDVDQTYLKCAIKRLDKCQMESSDVDDYKREVAVLKTLSGHPNVVQYLNNFETPRHYYLVMEYCETNLFDTIFIRCGLPISLVKRFFSDVAKGLHHSHSKGIYHRDIKVIIKTS